MEDRKMPLEEAIKHYAGRLNDPTTSSSVTGPCGDTIEFYINIEGDKVTEIRYHADGCGVTTACAALVAFYSDGRPLKEAFYVSPGLLLNTLGGVPEDHKHCPILAATAFYKALGDYLSKP
jgi:nitrogen fixation NifU-like protein